MDEVGEQVVEKVGKSWEKVGHKSGTSWNQLGKSWKKLWKKLENIGETVGKKLGKSWENVGKTFEKVGETVGNKFGKSWFWFKVRKQIQARNFVVASLTSVRLAGRLRSYLSHDTMTVILFLDCSRFKDSSG